MSDSKAISMNLMHEAVTVTDAIYAELLEDNVRERIEGLVRNEAVLPDGNLLGYSEKLTKAKLPNALSELNRAIAVIAKRMME